MTFWSARGEWGRSRDLALVAFNDPKIKMYIENFKMYKYEFFQKLVYTFNDIKSILPIFVPSVR